MRFFSPLTVYPEFSWHAVSVNEMPAYAFISHRQHVKNVSQMCFKEQSDIFSLDL